MTFQKRCAFDQSGFERPYRAVGVLFEVFTNVHVATYLTPSVEYCTTLSAEPSAVPGSYSGPLQQLCIRAKSAS
jgi:hypothetical protein